MYSVPYDPTSTPRELLQECEEVLREDQEGTQRISKTEGCASPRRNQGHPKNQGQGQASSEKDLMFHRLRASRVQGLIKGGFGILGVGA